MRIAVPLAPNSSSKLTPQLPPVPFRICKTLEFESGHILSKHLGKCRFPHGHSRRVEIVVTSDHLDANDMVCDFQVIKKMLSGFLDEWDHALCLNSADPHYSFYHETYGSHVITFSKVDPTSEIMAQTLFRLLHEVFVQRFSASASASGDAVSSGLRLERVRVSETSSSWAKYFE